MFKLLFGFQFMAAIYYLFAYEKIMVLEQINEYYT